jgi:glucose/arabinose dehydrogenase
MKFGVTLTAMLLVVAEPIVPAVLADDGTQGAGGLMTIAASSGLKSVSQKSGHAEDVKRMLGGIRMPPGFKIGLYAIVPDARQLAVGLSTGTVFVGTDNTKVWAVSDPDNNKVADEVVAIAPAARFKLPNGVCFDKEGALYVAELNRVSKFPDIETSYQRTDLQGESVVAQGKLVPEDEESSTHGRRVCKVGLDGKLYVALGQPYNVSPPDKLDLYNELGIGGIIRMDRDGTHREVFARGLRNSVGLDFNPANGDLWFTDNQVDRMGDDIPPGELNRATAAGQNFGFPWYGGGKVRTEEYKSSQPPADLVFPQVEEIAHAADLGMTFYTGAMFPASYRGGIFSAQHGSWNRSQPVGARVLFTTVSKDGTATESIPFAEGWLDQDSGEYLGRPVDVAQLSDGSILVSDDTAGAIYRIWYEQP